MGLRSVCQLQVCVIHRGFRHCRGDGCRTPIAPYPRGLVTDSSERAEWFRLTSDGLRRLGCTLFLRDWRLRTVQLWLIAPNTCFLGNGAAAPGSSAVASLACGPVHTFRRTVRACSRLCKAPRNVVSLFFFQDRGHMACPLCFAPLRNPQGHTDPPSASFVARLPRSLARPIILAAELASIASIVSIVLTLSHRSPRSPRSS